MKSVPGLWKSKAPLMIPRRLAFISRAVLCRESTERQSSFLEAPFNQKLGGGRCFTATSRNVGWLQGTDFKDREQNLNFLVLWDPSDKDSIALWKLHQGCQQSRGSSCLFL